MGHSTFMGFLSGPEFYDIWPRNELTKVYFEVLNHIGCFIEQKKLTSYLGIGYVHYFIIIQWGNLRVQGTVLARYDGICRVQIILTHKTSWPNAIPLSTLVTNTILILKKKITWNTTKSVGFQWEESI